MVKLQTGYLYHYAFAMLIGVAGARHLDDAREQHSDDRLADPLHGHLPAAGRRAADPARSGTRATSARRNIRYIALLTTVVTFVLSLFIWVGFDNADPGFQFVEKSDWLDSGISYHMGVDGISMLFVILTTFLMPLCILASWESIEKRVKEYMIAFLLLETLMIGVFCALDLVLFYVFFEAGLIPMFLIIGVWGGKRRVYAALQVLPLHAARLGADAARHHGDVLAGRHDRHPDAADAQFPGRACRPGCGSPSSPPSR